VNKYTHLSLAEREELYALRKMGLSFREIGNRLGRHHSTLSREWKRNAPYFQEYFPCRAHLKATNRACKQRSKAPLKNPMIFLYVREKLRKGWSPEIIAGRLSLTHPNYSIHHETIYCYIYRKETRQDRLWEYLPLGRKKRMKKEGRSVRRRSRIPDAISIDKRPKGVEKRKTGGHWETDNMEGKKEEKTVVSVTQERVSRYVMLSRLENGTAEAKTGSVIKRLKEKPEHLQLTLTTDNGSENSYHKEITKELGMSVYFCHPYHSWEKGSVENVIKRIRRYLPKKTTRLSKVSKEEIQMIEESINHMPMKCLGYLTPYEKMEELKFSL
jgi:IS30 family transposase